MERIHFTDKPFKFLVRGTIYGEEVYAYCHELEVAERYVGVIRKNGSGEAVVHTLPKEYEL